MSENLSFVITGANSCLGQAFVGYLNASPGTRLVLTTHSQCDFKGLQDEARVLHCANVDLLDERAVDELAGSIDGFLKGQFHILNCVGYFPGHAPIEEISLSTARRVYESNLLTVYSIASKLIPLMRERGGGHFVAFTSHSDYQCYPEMAAFTSAKAGLESLIRSIANEYSKDKIVANSLALATLLTEADTRRKPHGDHGNWLEPLEVCRVVRELVTAPFSLMNGNTIHLFKHSDTYFHQSYYERIASE